MLCKIIYLIHYYIYNALRFITKYAISILIKSYFLQATMILYSQTQSIISIYCFSFVYIEIYKCNVRKNIGWSQVLKRTLVNLCEIYPVFFHYLQRQTSSIICIYKIVVYLSFLYFSDSNVLWPHWTAINKTHQCRCQAPRIIRVRIYPIHIKVI